MAVSYCPRCQRANPEGSVFCYFDGIELRPGQGGAAANKLAQEFVFPSGRRTRTFEEFAVGCQDEWVPSRDLLRQGQFRTFFGSIGRADLAKAAQEAMGQADPDIALTTFLEALPGARPSAPRLDINPRRLLLGALLAGETRKLDFTITNQGQGTLQGTLTVAEGSDWLKIQGMAPGQTQIAIATAREQKITMLLDTKGVAAAQTYGAKLTVITNGGVVEVPLRMDLVAQPFTKAPFQGVKTPREMAERMRKQPKAAGPALEGGEVARWFANNGWNYPVAGTPAKGVAGVQQFFEAMGLSKPPKVKLSLEEMKLRCKYPETVRLQVGLQTPAKKWVYAQVTSETPWLRVLTPQVGGPQQATIAFEVDSNLAISGSNEGNLQVTANGGQKLILRVLADVQGAPPRRKPVPPPPVVTGSPPSHPGPILAPTATFAQTNIPALTRTGGGIGLGLLKPVIAMGLAFFLLRLLLVPVVDFGGRGAAARSAARDLDLRVDDQSPLGQVGGWLQLPWASILAGTGGSIDKNLFQTGATGTISAADFRHHFAGYFIRAVVLFTWWIGAAAGCILVWQRGGGKMDWIWGLVAGSVAGVAGSASLACGFLVLEILPHALWGNAGGNFGLLLVWVIVSAAAWMVLGALLGLLGIVLPPIHGFLIVPVQRAMAWLCGICGLRRLALSLAPSS